MDIFVNPNLAYLLLVAGALLAMLAIFTPGTGILEIGALFMLILASWQAFLLEINLWALILLALGVFPFLLAVRKSRKLVYLGIAIVAFVLGSSFLFRGDAWYLPAVNPFLALATSLLAGGYLWIAINKVLEAELTLPSHDLSALMGDIGETQSEVHNEGSVQVAGELWTARSDQLIPAGTRVRVIGREGFFLIVEKVE